MSYIYFIPAVLFAVYLVSSLISAFHHWKRARQLGSQKPARRRQSLLGLDIVLRLFKASKRQKLPDEFVRIYEDDMHHATTWEQSVFGTRNLVTVDPQNIQAILAKQFHDFGLGPTRRGNLGVMLGDGIFTADGKPWEHSRALLRPQFARDRVADLHIEEEHAQNMFHHLPVDADGWTSPIDLSPLFFRFTIDSSFEFLFGESVHSQNAALPDDSPAKRHVETRAGIDPAYVAQCFDGATYTLGQRIAMGELYWLFSPKSLRQQVKVVEEFADYYVKRILQAKDSGDLLSATGNDGKKYVFLRELAKSTTDPIELRSSLLHLLLAGRDTTAGLLGYVWWNLARHPEVFRKLRATIIEHFGTYDNPREITFAELKSCAYLQAVLSETLRLYPSVPVNSRRALRDTTLPRGGGPDGTAPVYVKKGTEVNYQVYVMHRRKDLWGADAAEWKPERWEGRRPGWEYLPFNGGPRICLKQQFALTQAGYVTTRMLQRFDRLVSLDGNSAGDGPLHSVGLTAAPAQVLVKLHEQGREN
ncbi:hypothetical protein VTN96DRAFT_3882 [Rasamsonia emersonii]